MYKRVLNFLNKRKILTDSQYGLRRKRSRNLSVLELVSSKISKAVINKRDYTLNYNNDLKRVYMCWNSLQNEARHNTHFCHSMRCK